MVNSLSKELKLLDAPKAGGYPFKNRV